MVDERPRVMPLALALVALAAGCQFEPTVPNSTTIACTPSGAACPQGFTCREAIGRCVDNAVLRQPSVSATGARLAPPAGNASTHFTLDFDVTAPLATAPSAVAVPAESVPGGPASYAFDCQLCTSSLACHCDFIPQSNSLPPEGTLRVAVSLVDLAGNTPSDIAVGSVDFDTTPPSLTGPASLQLTAPPGVTTPISALGNGTSAQICFTIDEALSSSPSVWAGGLTPDGGLQFALELGYPQGLSYCYQGTLDASVPLVDGPAAAFALAVDLAGNAALLPLATAPNAGPLLTIERTPPAAPDVTSATGLRFHRAPWGELPTIGQPHLALVSSGPVATVAGTLLAYADSAESAELGRTAIVPGEAANLTLAADEPIIWVDEADLAGNRLAGGPIEVKQIDWVVNLGHKLAGDLSANPHDCYARAQAGPSLVQADDTRTELDGSSGPVGLDGGTLLAGAPSWRQRKPGAASATVASAYDPARGLVLSFDGQVSTSAFDGVDWSPVDSARQPTERFGTSMAFDRARGRAVLFGGIGQATDNADLLCDTWELGPQGWEVVDACSAAPDGGATPLGRPSPRSGACLVYDPVRQRTVLIGGEDYQHSNLSDVWEWDGSTWTQTASTSPLACTPGRIVFDEALPGAPGLVEVEPGLTASVGRWTGTAYAWTRASLPVVSGASPTSLVIDPVSLALVSSVVVDAAVGPVQLWSWDGASSAGWALAGDVPPWTTGSIPPPTLLPLADRQTQAASIAVLAANSAGTLESVEACGLAGFHCAVLHQQPAATLPSQKVANSLAFDNLGNGLFTGGTVEYPDDADASMPLLTWSWETQDWTAVATPTPGPGYRSLAGLSYFAPTGEFWLVGGGLADGGEATDSWIYTVDAGWQAAGMLDFTADNFYGPGYIPGNGGLPIWTWGMAEVPDLTFPGLVLSGTGYPTMLIYELNGQLIASQQSVDDSPEGAFAYDLARHRAVIADINGPIWEATSPSFEYTQVFPNTGYYASQVVYDGAARSTLLVGGEAPTPADALGVVLRWDGTTLSMLAPVDPENDGDPLSEGVVTVAYDPGSERTRQLNSSSAGPDSPSLATWDLNLAQYHPAVVCQFRFAGANAPAGATLTGLQVEASATATAPDGTPAAAVLALWSQQAWRETQRCATPDCLPMRYAALDAQTLPELFDDLDTLGISVASSVDNGSGLASVDVQSVQATLSYQLP